MADDVNNVPSPDFALPDEPPTWPTVVGTISVVWASLNLICGGCGVLSPLLTNYAAKMSEAQLGPMPDVMRPGAMQVGLAAASLLWAVLLLIAGIMLTLRRPVARPLHLVYAAGSIVLSVVATAISLVIQGRMNEWVANNPGDKWAQQHNPTVGYVMLGVAVLLGLAWPLFLLIWFGLVKRRPADLTGHAAAA